MKLYSISSGEKSNNFELKIKTETLRKHATWARLFRKIYSVQRPLVGKKNERHNVIHFQVFSHLFNTFIAACNQKIYYH